MAMTHYKSQLHARTFGGRSDGDLDMRHENVVTIQKWINLMSLMIDEYKGKGRYVMRMDPAYMGTSCVTGQLSCQLGRA
ncbi:hypothetical protein ACHAW5_004440 [Stephanodiscus triporus]|uniref:Uncharacterized protein n=1 Tax=Stephanodiscus triporus TaxID=2934178 RepID=A0ABD3Q7V1_9STRA